MPQLIADSTFFIQTIFLLKCLPLSSPSNTQRKHLLSTKSNSLSAPSSDERAVNGPKDKLKLKTGYLETIYGYGERMYIFIMVSFTTEPSTNRSARKHAPLFTNTLEHGEERDRPFHSCSPYILSKLFCLAQNESFSASFHFIFPLPINFILNDV